MKAVKPAEPRTREDLTVAEHMMIRIEPGTRLDIEGLQKGCVFVRYVRASTGNEWVDVMTPRGASRTVRPERITTVHLGREA